MYNQKQAISVQVLYDLAVNRKDVDARELRDVAIKLFDESKLVDLDQLKVIYSADTVESEYVSYTKLPEIVKQLTALVVCLQRRWFKDLSRGSVSIMERFKLTCNPTDFWHNSGIFKHDEIKCKNMEELVEKIIGKI